MPRTTTLLALFALLALPLTGCEWGAPPALPFGGQAETAPEQDPGVEIDDGADPADEQLPTDYPWDEARPPQLDDLALMQLPTGRDITDSADEMEDRDEPEPPEDSEPVEGGYSSFLVGAASLLVMEAGALVVLAPPSAVLYDTFWNGQVTQTAWNAWEWEKTTVVEETTFVATLSAEITWSGYALDMVVDAYNADGAITDYLWYDGLVSWDGNVGDWTMYDLDGVEIAWYDYALDGPDGDVASLEVALGTLTATVDGDYRQMDFVDTEEQHLTVTWDAVTAEGSVVNPSYNDGDEACWDGDLQNVACY